ncbi:hypothetical protein AXW67_20890 [Bradyrhizobium neotropicale]|uniref:Uncharacterized protein n=1 Tax=Bradyrhizobium neotropicale TaxID=1497615 RepID=A0A176YXY3_9BRAD|nr:hypothetical protein AXW67_20890 [Bradyrhizobium neotropicale]
MRSRLIMCIRILQLTHPNVQACILVFIKALATFGFEAAPGAGEACARLLPPGPGQVLIAPRGPVRYPAGKA